MGGIWLTLAFIFRVASIFNQTSLGLFSAQFILILISPLWINAYCYMVLGRMIHYFTPGQTVLKLNARRLALIFVLLDITYLSLPQLWLPQLLIKVIQSIPGASRRRPSHSQH